MTKHIYLFRHGETEWNKLEKVQGLKDIELSQEGIEQAKNIPQHLQSKNIEIIFSSHLKRAYETAEVVAKKLDLKIIVHQNLHEIDFGDAAGKHRSELSNLYEKIEKNWTSADPKYDNLRFPNAESKIEVRTRGLNALKEIVEKYSFNNIGISSHGFIIKQLIIASGSDDHKYLQNCEIVHIKYNGDKFEFVERIKTQGDAEI